MILNTFDEYKEALKKCHLSESVMPLKRGYLVENVDLYNKVQKMLNCPDMEECHPYLYGVDVDNLNESDEEKIEKLYDLGVERKFIEDDPEDEEGDVYAGQMVDGETDDLTGVQNVDGTASQTDALSQADGYADQATQTTVQPTVQQTFQKAQPVARQCAFTVLYSAMKDGEITTGEYYSNSLNTRSAKSDAIANLAKLGFDNIKVLAIQAGDPDMAGEEDGELATEAEDTDDSAEEMSEAEDTEELTEAEEVDAKKDAKDAFEQAKKDDTEEPKDVKSFLSSQKDALNKVKGALKKAEAKKAFDKIVDFLEKYSDEDKELADKIDAYVSRADEAVGSKKKKNPVRTLIRGLVRVLLGCVFLTGKIIGGSGKIASYLLNVVETILCSSAKKLDSYLPESKDDDKDSKEQVNEDLGGDFITFDMFQRAFNQFRSDARPSIIAGVGTTEDSAENYIDGAGIKNMSVAGTPTADSIVINIEVGDGNVGKLWSVEEIRAFLNTIRSRGRGKKLLLQIGYEDGTDFNGVEVQPHEILDIDPDSASDIINIALAPFADESVMEASDEEEAGIDDDDGEDIEDVADDSDEETDSSLTPEKKAELKGAYTKAFKKALQQLKYTKCVDDLTVAEKAEFWRTLGTIWMQEAPSQFLTAKEQAALQKIVLKK